MCHDYDVDFTGSLKVLEAVTFLSCSLISETITIFVIGVSWWWFLIKWEQLQSFSVRLDKARFYYSLYFSPPPLFSDFDYPLLGLTLLVVQSIMRSKKVKKQKC